MNRTNRKARALAAMSATISVLALSYSIKAATITWTGGDSNTWSDPGDWSGLTGSQLYPGDSTGAVTNNTDAAVFPAGTGVYSVVLDFSTLNLQNISFTGANSYTISGQSPGNEFWLTAGGSVQYASNTSTNVVQTISTPVVLEGNYTFLNSNTTGSSNNLVFNGTGITNAAASATTLTLDGTGNTVISAPISNGSGGALSIVKQGTGIATLSGTNAYTGNTTINQGVVVFGSIASIGGSGASINVGANGAVGDATGLFESGFLSRINNTGNGGTLALTAADSNDTLDFSASGNLASFSNWYIGGGDGSTFSGTIVPASGQYRFAGDGPLTVATNLSGSNSLLVGNGHSQGVITFSGTNSYTGGTILNSGVTVFQNPATAIGGTGQNLQVNAPAAVASGTGILDTNLLSRISPTSTGALAITSADAATNFDFTSAPLNAVPNMGIGTNGNVTYTGTITPANSTYRVGGGVGTMDFPNANQFTGSNDLVISGTVEIDNSNNFTGTTTVNNGTVILGGGKTAAATWLNASTITLNNSTLQLDGFGSKTTGYPANTNNINVPAGSNSTINTSDSVGWGGNLTGAGTVNFVVNYVRAGAYGTWSGFTGQINITGIGTSGNNFEIGVAGTAPAVNSLSAPDATVHLDNVLLYLGHKVNPANNVPSVISWGELDGTATAQLGGQEAGGYPGRVLIWQIGSLNTNSLFAGTITDQAQKSAPVGATGLTKVGTGILTLTGNNTYGGPTAVSGGTLQIGNGGTTGTLGTDGTTSGPVTLTTPGILAFDRSDSVTVPHNISGTGEVVQMGTGTLTMTGTNSYTGGTLVQSGTLQGTPTALTGTVTLAGGNLNLDGAGSTSMVVAGSGTVNKINSGAITFTAPQTFTGSMIVQGGSLQFTGSNANGVTLQNGTSLVASTPSAFSINSLTLGSSASDSVSLMLNNGSVPTSFSVTGNNGLVANGNVTLNLGTVTLSVGNYDLINYTGTIGGKGFSAFSTSSLSPRVQATLQNTGSAIDLDVTSVDAPKWTGAVNGNWDINTTANWKLINAGTATTYLQPSIPGDAVLFDDTATGTTTVNVAATVDPQTFTVNNSAKSYTFTGSGQISGPTSLVKQGTASLTISNTGGNNWTGGTQILGGTLVTGNSTALPAAGNITINNGATLDLGGNSPSFSGAVSLVNGTIQNGSITKSGADYDLQSGSVSAQLSGSAGLTKSGSGTVVLTNANNNYSGATTVNAGTLQIGDGTVTIPLPMAATNNGNIDWKVAGSDSVTYSGFISGGGITTVDMGPGATFTISGSTTNITAPTAGQVISGPTVINGGNLVLNGASTAPTDVASLVGSTLTLNSGAALTANGFDVFGLNTAHPVTSLTLNAGTTATITSGGSAELYNSLVLNGGTLSGDGTWSIHGGPSVTANSLINVATLGVNSSRTLTINSGVTLNVTSPSLTGGPLTVQSNGTNGAGTGIMVLDPAVQDALTGLTLHGGEVGISADTSLPQGTNAINFTGGTLQVTGTSLTTIDSHTVNWAGFQGGFDIADPTNVFTVNSAISDVTGATPTIGNLSKSGPGTLVVSGANTYSGGTTISAGTLQTPELANLGTGNITINGGALLVTDSSALATIKSDLTASYDKGAWDTGIFRSNAIVTNGRTLGYSAVAGGVAVMYTLPGDLDLSGSVNSADATAMAAGNGSSWAQGDLNYDGVKNADDWSLFMLGASLGSLPAPPAPEPTMAGALVIAAGLGLGGRRQRNRRR